MKGRVVRQPRSKTDVVYWIDAILIEMATVRSMGIERSSPGPGQGKRYAASQCCGEQGAPDY